MKLWILTRKQESKRWDVLYDVALGFVVRAGSEKKARQTASEQAGDEGREAWLDAKHSDCELLTPDGEAGVILCDFNNG